MRCLTLLALATTTLTHAALSPADTEAVRQLVRDRKLAEAHTAATKLAADFPQEAEAHALVGTVAMNQQTPEPAVKAFERAVELAPASSEMHRRLGDAYGFSAQKAGVLSKLGWAKKCLAAYEKAVALDPANFAARQSLVGYYSQAPGLVGGGMDKAHAQADAMIKLDPTRGKIAKAGLFAREKKYDEAFALYEESLAANPDDYSSLYQVGRLAAETGQRLDVGLAALQRCLTLEPTAGAPGRAPTHWRLGNIWEKKGDKTAARAAYEAALAADGNFENARTALKKL